MRLAELFEKSKLLLDVENLKKIVAFLDDYNNELSHINNRFKIHTIDPDKPDTSLLENLLEDIENILYNENTSWKNIYNSLSQKPIIIQLKVEGSACLSLSTQTAILVMLHFLKNYKTEPIPIQHFFASLCMPSVYPAKIFHELINKQDIPRYYRFMIELISFVKNHGGQIEKFVENNIINLIKTFSPNEIKALIEICNQHYADNNNLIDVYLKNINFYSLLCAKSNNEQYDFIIPMKLLSAFIDKKELLLNLENQTEDFSVLKQDFEMVYILNTDISPSDENVAMEDFKTALAISRAYVCSYHYKKVTQISPAIVLDMMKIDTPQNTPH